MIQVRCTNCGRLVKRRDRCTNGRCPKCHRSACTPGGDTSPGHAAIGGYKFPPNRFGFDQIDIDRRVT